MTTNIKEIIPEVQNKLEQVENLDQLLALKKSCLGKKGQLSELLKSIGNLSIEEKKTFGRELNEVKQTLESIFDEREQSVKSQEKLQSFQDELAVTLPGKPKAVGLEHPLVATKYRIIDFFQSIGFIPLEGPEIEQDYYNFEALNIPEGHPARDDQDSFYLKDHFMLRTQTSPMQIRSMEVSKPPTAIISPGKVFRRDTLDATHSYCFHQVEGLLVDKGINFTHLKGLLVRFCRDFFGNNINFRFRPDFFPFTEPSCEIAIEYPGKSDGWLEILGAGMVNPIVLKNMGVDPEEYTGLAFGLGIERIAMLLYGIDDIRLFYENDYHFLEQFTNISNQ